MIRLVHEMHNLTVLCLFIPTVIFNVGVVKISQQTLELIQRTDKQG